MNVNTQIEVDLIKFLETVIEGIESDHDYAYPNGYFHADRAHSTLQSIKGRVRSLRAFVRASKPKETPKDEG